MKGRIRSAPASAKKVNTVWVYPRCRVATQRMWLSGGASPTARSPSELASRRRYAKSGVEREESDPRKVVALVNDRPVTVLLEV